MVISWDLLEKAASNGNAGTRPTVLQFIEQQVDESIRNFNLRCVDGVLEFDLIVPHRWELDKSSAEARDFRGCCVERAFAMLRERGEQRRGSNEAPSNHATAEEVLRAVSAEAVHTQILETIEPYAKALAATIQPAEPLTEEERREMEADTESIYDLLKPLGKYK